MGSPPLTRGKAFSCCALPSIDWITPAYAGKSTFRPGGGTRRQDHPRLRGEKQQRGYAETGLLGSPPLTRGKGQECLGLEYAPGITPAYAGKSKGEIVPHDSEKDHPRLRGEKTCFSFGNLFIAGSPPLTRGKGIAISAHARVIRITPAYAGKSLKFRRGLRVLRDHPRLRGEKYSCSHASILCVGSPPLTRGKVPR